MRAQFAAILGMLIALAAPVSAQPWQSTINDSGALMSASAAAPGNTLRFSCTAPSPTRRPLIETGDHEAQRTDTPFTMTVIVGDGLLDPGAVSRDLAAPRLTVGGTTYGLPPMIWDEFFWNWHTTLSMGDQMITALTSAGDLVFDPGRGTAYSFGGAGLSRALTRTMSYCITGWQIAGQGVPPNLRYVLEAAAAQTTPTPSAPEMTTAPPPPVSPNWPGYAPVRSSTLPPGYRLAPLLPLPATPPPAGDAHLSERCQGSWVSDPNHVQVADLDGDGQGDYVLNWSGVECQGGLTGRAYCGAANCSIDVFLSSRAYAAPSEFLGVAADVVLDAQGRIGLLLSGTLSLCADGVCDTPFYWTGNGFSQ